MLACLALVGRVLKLLATFILSKGPIYIAFYASVSSGSSTSTFSTHSLAFTCIHMHYGEAHETRLIMHAQCVRLHTNAVSMRQCANAAGRQNATHSTMHPNASVCTTDRM